MVRKQRVDGNTDEFSEVAEFDREVARANGRG